MAHTIHEKKKMLHRIRRIRGQVEAVEKALVQERDCTFILQTVAACRGAINGLMAQIIEGHIREHVLDPHASNPPERVQAAQELVDVVKAYLK
ncbi:MAG: metal/formaldehyde-sensitive transcriptional repressor [Phycisphaeraceae bacterium]|nr:metal/formaldehyde-sensitive transcriptional repressor [Phycisphaeraceae bacterium]